MKHITLCLIVYFSIINFGNLSLAQWIRTNNFSGIHAGVATSGTDLFASYDNRIYHTSDFGVTWSRADSTIPPNILVLSLCFHGTNLLAGIEREGVFVSSDYGKTWKQSGLKRFDSDGTMVHSIVSDNINIFAGTNKGVFRSSDSGSNWMLVGFENINVDNVFICPNGTGGTSVFASTNPLGFYRSTDDGMNWTSINPGLPNPYGVIVTGMGCSGTILFAGTAVGVYRSNDYGFSWTAVNNAMIEDYVTAIAVYGNKIFAGTEWKGVFLSMDSGASWSTVNSNVTDGVNTLIICGPYIFWGGTWRRPLSEMTTTSVKSSTDLPINFILEQNFPNPFNPSTSIAYEIPKSSFVSLDVYDMLGRKLKTLVKEDKAIGKYNVQFNADKLSSGTYFYSLRTKDFIQTKKMILLK
ncbi:MAG: T9SS type A sorting domain-containing protein [Ignavibacteriales bacterium]|nr:T9SS type A sorting domain-containing protein [Ignavibacteriales bacterium]